MTCPRCGAAVAANKRFCGDCGTALPWQCGSCGSENPADKRFCCDCGAARSSTATTPKGHDATPSPERRLLSVMFIDLVGSTALGQQLDAEDLRETINAFQAHVTSLIACFDGFIARHMGDGVLVYFGYPHADEADAERAIRAGLTIIDAVQRLNTPAGPPGTLKVRIGIDTGLVVVGDLIGFGASREAAVVGDTPNLAARLQSVAEPGSVLISDATHLLVGSLFECRELALPNLKGRRGPERGWVVLGENVIDSRYEALRRGQLSLVNRTEELELLLRRWEQARAGEGRVVLLTGEPGIGKSRLVAALEQYAAIGGHRCLRFLCSPHHIDTPLYPVIQHIERAAKFQRGDSPSTKWDKLDGVLPEDTSVEDKAVLADFLSIQFSDADFLKTVTPQRRKSMVFTAISRRLDAIAHRQPVLAILEDMHWADPTTLELLNLLVEAVQRLPVLLVITGRPEVRAPWASRPHVMVKLLSGLEDELAAMLIKQIAGGRELPGDVVERIIAHADSVPLFIEELTKTVLGGLQGAEHGSIASLSADVVPPSLYSSLMARLDRLRVGKEVARTGAVIGREFSFELMEAVSELPAQRLEEALSELAQAEIVVPHGEPPSATYTFKHALVQDAAYASLLRDQRRMIHRRVAETLERNADETVEPQLIAWHFTEAAAPDRSVHYYQKAAQRATGRFALAEMVHHLRNALRQIAHIPSSVERQRLELTLQLDLGRVLIDHEGADSEAVRTTFERARELCWALDEVQLLPPVYDGLVVNWHFIHSQPERIFQYSDEMLAAHSKSQDPRLLLMTRRVRGLANLLLGRFDAANGEMRSVIDMYVPERDGPNAGMTIRDPKASTCSFLGLCRTIQGYTETGAAMSRSAVDFAETLNHPISLNLGLRRACAQAMLQKDVRRVAEFADRLIALRAGYETYKGSWEGTFFHDWAQMCARPDPVLFDRMQVFLHRLDATKNWALLPLYLVSTAELSGQAGDVAGAAAMLERAADITNLTGSRWCEAEIIRLQARYGARDAEQAVALLRSSLALAREQGAKLWELRTATDMARLLRDLGDAAGARAVLAPVYGWFTEGMETSDVVEAQTLLAEIGQA
jgi:class 3 adenylate cyclase